MHILWLYMQMESINEKANFGPLILQVHVIINNIGMIFSSDHAVIIFICFYWQCRIFDLNSYLWNL